MLIVLLIFIATLFYNLINGLSSIFIARGLIKFGAFFNAFQNVVYILILTFVLKDVRENYYLLVPLFIGYFSGMMISGYIVDKMQLGDITITGFVDGDDIRAKKFAKTLNANGIMNTSFTGNGARSKTIAIIVITNRKNQERTIKNIKQIAQLENVNIKITVSDTAQWSNKS